MFYKTTCWIAEQLQQSLIKCTHFMTQYWLIKKNKKLATQLLLISAYILNHRKRILKPSIIANWLNIYIYWTMVNNKRTSVCGQSMCLIDWVIYNNKSHNLSLSIRIVRLMRLLCVIVFLFQPSGTLGFVYEYDWHWDVEFRDYVFQF